MTHHDMDRLPTHDAALERLAWRTLVACVGLVPLAVATIPFSSLRIAVSPFVFPQTVALAVGLALVLAFWAGALLKGQTQLVLSWSMIPFAVLAAWATVATVAGYEPLGSLLGFSTGALSFTHVVMYCIAVFLAEQLLDSQRRMRVLTWTVVASGSLVGLVALAQQLLHARIFDLPMEDWVVARGFATIGNPDHLGTYLVLPVLLSVVLSLCEETRIRRATALACLAVLLAATVGTLTRGAWIAVLFGAFLAVVLLWRSLRAGAIGTWPLIVLGVCISTVAVSLVMANPADLASRFAVAPQNPGTEEALGTINSLSSDRINLWRSSLRIVADRPLTGTGPDSFALGWYPNAVTPSTAGGEVAIARDPHSLIFLVLATTGVPGFIVFVFAVLSALVYGGRTVAALAKRPPFSGVGLYYVAWFVAASGLQVALLLAAVSTPILLYAFLSLAVLLRPAARKAHETSALLVRQLPAVAAIVLAILLVASVAPSTAAEATLAQALRSESADRARVSVELAPWNIDVQRAYYLFMASRVTVALGERTVDASEAVNALAAELAQVGVRQPHEYYYPSVRAQILTNASVQLGDASYAEAAIAAADEALAIMPGSVLTRAHKALALSELGRYNEMVSTLDGYWQNETSSSYAGILYAQGLALSGSPEGAEAVFRTLTARFPEESAVIEASRQETQMLLQRR